MHIKYPSVLSSSYFMKRKLKQWWSTIPPISTKRTSISNLKSLNMKRP